jgi:predicted ATPase/DNA-binding CsgD family transcriptional regulator
MICIRTRVFFQIPSVLQLTYESIGDARFVQMPPSEFPIQQTPFVGRQEELSEIAALLVDPACCLLTLVGPGGIGKTRLAIEASQQLQANFADGVYFVNLQPVVSSTFLVSTIADSIKIPLFGQQNPRILLLNFLHNKEILLVLDNFEHLLDGVDLLTEVLQTAPGIRLLVTSRELLNLQEEWLYTVRGMDFPATDDADDFQTYSAVQLFVERTRRVRRNFSLIDERPGVNRVCRTLQGMPLAIELAASWTKTLTCMEIASEIQRNLDFLATNLRNVPERHQSIQAVFTQSWRLLTEQESSVFRKLSVFRGGFRREAAEQVAGASLRILTGLVDKSLLTWGHNGRYQIHELLRQYAAQKLEMHSGEVSRVRHLHCAYYADFIKDRDAAIQGGEQLRAKAEFEADLENIRGAWQWAAEQIKIEEIRKAAQSLGLFYHFTSRYLEAADAFAKAADNLENAGQEGVVLALVLTNQGWFALRLGQIEKARAVLEKSHTIYQTHNAIPPPLFGTEPLAPLCIVAVVSGDYGRAAQLGEQARQACEARGDIYNLLAAYYGLTGAALAQGDYLTARQFAERACAIAQITNNGYMMAYCLIELGNAFLALGYRAEAQHHFEASYALRESFHDPEGMAAALNRMGKVNLLQGKYYEAKQLYQRSLTLYRDLGDRGGLANALVALGTAARALKEYAASSKHFHEALQTALDAHLTPLVLSIFINIAELFMETSRQAEGIELCALALHHPVTDHETKQRAQLLLFRFQVSPDSLQHQSSDDFMWVTAALLSKLLVFEETTVASPASQTDVAFVEPLSEREQEVLRLVAAGLSNREIAEQLVLAVSTVKWYLNEIFNKLDVNSRTQAVRRAKALNLLR